MSSLFRLLPAATVAAAAFAASAPAAHAAVPCFKTFDGAGSGWKVQNDGSLMQSLQSNGSAGDQNHGRLSVGGVAYPKLDGDLCVQGTTSMSLPTRSVGGFNVSRSVSEVGGKLRWLDTITNPGAGKMLAVDFGLEVLPSQVIKVSESGNDSADGDDHWTVHQSTSLFSTHQWGQDGAIAQPDVVSEDGGPPWEDDFGDMDDDATLGYSFFIGAGQTVRLLHATGTAGTQPDAVASAKNAAGLFAGYTRAIADDVVNFTDDPDGDGVTKFADDCPSVKADSANGCPKIIVPVPPADPVDPEAPAPQPGDQPAGDPAPSNGGGSGAPAPTPTNGGVAADKTGPVITIGGVPTKGVRRGALTRRTGTTLSITCNEDCRYTAKLVVKKRGKKLPVTIQQRSEQGLTANRRELRLKVRSSKLTRLSSQRATLIVEATDRAGNRSTVQRVIKLR